MEFVTVDAADAPWETMDGYGDRMFSQRRSWLEFVADVAGGRIIVAELKDAGETVGWYSGILFHRFGMPILGSPFPGWTTTYMGFNLKPDVPRQEALPALRSFAFSDLGCQHLEVLDRHFTMDDVAALDLDLDVVREPTFMTDLSVDEDQLFADMSSSCRRCIRKGQKNGLTVEEAEPEGFGAEYHEQLTDVFAKQDLQPLYTREYVQSLIDKIHPTGDMLLLRARDPSGLKIASAIYFGYKNHSMFWGNGSFREHQIHRPNEALHWYALRYWKARGVQFHDWCGPAPYKRKYGPKDFEVPRIRMSRYRLVRWARDAAYRVYKLPRVLKERRFKNQIEAKAKTSASPDKAVTMPPPKDGSGNVEHHRHD